MASPSFESNVVIVKIQNFIFQYQIAVEFVKMLQCRTGGWYGKWTHGLVSHPLLSDLLWMLLGSLLWPSCGSCRWMWMLFRLWGVQWTLQPQYLGRDLKYDRLHFPVNGFITRILNCHVNCLILHQRHAPIMTSSYIEPRPHKSLSRDLNTISSVKTNKTCNVYLISGNDRFHAAFPAEVKKKM